MVTFISTPRIRTDCLLFIICKFRIFYCIFKPSFLLDRPNFTRNLIPGARPFLPKAVRTCPRLKTGNFQIKWFTDMVTEVMICILSFCYEVFDIGGRVTIKAVMDKEQVSQVVEVFKFKKSKFFHSWFGVCGVVRQQVL